MEHEKYILKVVPISEIPGVGWEPDDPQIKEYMEMSLETMPPIVLGRKYPYLNKYDIIDGSHRLKVLENKGYREIKAYMSH